MKHTLKITVILILVFLTSQILGLAIINGHIDYEKTAETGKTTLKNLPFGIERPEVNESTSFIYIVMAILVGTFLLILLIKYKKIGLWKFWFSLSVAVTLTIAFSAFLNQGIALALGALFAYLKVSKPNIFIHNFTEIFIYGGLAVIFIPIINLFSAFMLLILISLYDFYAVWKSKHMIKLAEFQIDTKLFAGFFIPYSLKHKNIGGTIKKGKVVRVKNAILGGGDVGFPLIFTGVVLKTLMDNGIARGTAFAESLIVTAFITAALIFLLIKSEKDKFYPAMPILTIGCFLGYFVIRFLIL